MTMRRTRDRHTGLLEQLDKANSLEFESAAAYLEAASRAVAMAAEVPDTPCALAIRVTSELGNARRVNGEFAGAIEALDDAIVRAGELQPGVERSEILALAHLR